jgi:L(+)-tartrate dehydratase alpha subunit
MGPLRHNAVETFDEKNTGTNTGTNIPWLDWRIVPENDSCTIDVYMAGGGCTLPGAAKVLMPGQGYEGVAEFVMDVITERGVNACPPLLVGLGCRPRWKRQPACPSWRSCARWIPRAPIRAPR